MTKHNVRIELFFKTNEELRQRIRFLSERGIRAFNIVNKNDQDTVKEWVDIIREEISGDCNDNFYSVCAHYSVKYNKNGKKKDAVFQKFASFVDNMEDSGRCHDNEILLISGGGKKGKFNSVTALQQLQNQRKQTKLCNGAHTTHTKTHQFSSCIAVAFNPFLPCKADSEEEEKRLLQKLATNQVRKIYFQFGTDLERLRASLDWLSNVQREDRQKEGNLDRRKPTARIKSNFSICGSIFLPTRKLIAQQRFRPWNGVFLGDDFCTEEGATAIVLDMMKLYDFYGCEILIEAPGVRNEKDMAVVERLLGECDWSGGCSMISSSILSNALGSEDANDTKKEDYGHGQREARSISTVDSGARFPKTRKVDSMASYPNIVP